jgi:hypothetical protein
MNKRAVIFLFSIFFILIISSASATLYIGNSSHLIEKKYGASQNIIGWINVSINGENTSATFKDSLNNEISLIDLLRQNPKINYSCAPNKDCEKYYATSGENNGAITSNGNKILGMAFTGNIEKINSIKFDLRIPDAGLAPSCTNQLKVDFFNDGIIDFSNNNSDASICSGTRSYGCFNTSASSELSKIELDSYCQRINLSEAPGFRLGAWVIKAGTTKRNLTMSLYDLSGVDSLASCKLPDASASGGEISCDVNYALNFPREHYVCLGASSGTGEYKTKVTEDLDRCGFLNSPPSEENSAYWIFAEAKKFGTVKNILVRNTLPNEQELSIMTQDYLNKRYEGMNCSRSGGCVVPLTIMVNKPAEKITGYIEGDDAAPATDSPTVFIENINIDWQTSGAHPTKNNLYDLSETPSKVISKFGKLYLDASGLKVRDTLGNFTYSLRFNGQSIFSETLSVQKGPLIKGLSPLQTGYAIPTQFEVNVEPVQNVSRYEWNFGDNITETTSANKTTHTYNISGDYNLQIIIRDKNNISSSRIFVINVTSPASFINSTLIKMKDDLASIKSQIDSYDLFYRASLNKAVDTNNLSLKVSQIENRYKTANESSYRGIISDLFNLKIPESIITTTIAPNYVFYPEGNNVNLDILKEIGGGTYGNQGDATDAIYSWNTENIINNMTFKEISARYSGTSEPILRIFDIKIQEKTALNYKAYFIIKDLENLMFKENYDERDADGYTYINITGGAKNIVFSTTENVNFENLPAFIAPPLSKLVVTESSGGEPTESVSPFSWQVFAFYIGILLVVGIAVYIIMRSWYKRRYENHLFKNKTDFYNLLNYIEGQRRKGASESEIHEKLKNAGWTSEQIRHSIKRHSGKKIWGVD